MKTKQTAAPTALQIARAAFPRWAGRKVKTVTTGTVQMFGMAADGGTWNEYAAVNIATGKVAPMPASMRTPREMGGTDGDYTVSVPAGFAIVCHAYFCGHDCGCTVTYSAAPAIAGTERLSLP